MDRFRQLRRPKTSRGSNALGNHRRSAREKRKTNLKESDGEEERDVDAGELLDQKQEEEDRQRLVARRLLESRPLRLLRSVLVQVHLLLGNIFLVIPDENAQMHIGKSFKSVLGLRVVAVEKLEGFGGVFDATLGDKVDGRLGHVDPYQHDGENREDDGEPCDQPPWETSAADVRENHAEWGNCWAAGDKTSPQVGSRHFGNVNNSRWRSQCAGDSGEYSSRQNEVNVRCHRYENEPEHGWKGRDLQRVDPSNGVHQVTADDGANWNHQDDDGSDEAGERLRHLGKATFGVFQLRHKHCRVRQRDANEDVEARGQNRRDDLREKPKRVV